MMNLERKSLLVISPHPDDEVLGSGGLIRKVKEKGGSVYILYMTVGDTNDYSENGWSSKDERLIEIEKVAKYMKYDDYHIAFPGNTHHLRLDTIAQKDLISCIEKESKLSIDRLRPDILVTPQETDYNQDHRAVAEAVKSATRPHDMKYLPSAILGFENAANMNWGLGDVNEPDIFIEISNEDLKSKIRAMQLYKSQNRNGNSPRAPRIIQSLAYLRGCHIGTYAAEAFAGYRLKC